ncbi:MAG: zinc-ribbon domain-containing protein [Candidatus Limivicinus sp.]|nr:zinc-ribbon domain-containing protein [Candidatus Limivicinus sp.]
MKESLLLEWDYVKNGNVDPASVKDHSNKKFFWICPKGHPSYLMPVMTQSLRKAS